MCFYGIYYIRRIFFYGEEYMSFFTELVRDFNAPAFIAGVCSASAVIIAFVVFYCISIE